MKGLDVVGATGGTVGVIGGAAEIASGIGTGGVEVGDVGARIVSVGSSPCSVCGALEVLPWEGLLKVQNSPPTDSICRE